MNITRGQETTKPTSPAPSKLIITTTREPSKITAPPSTVRIPETSTTTEAILIATPRPTDDLVKDTHTPIVPIFNRIDNDEDKSADMEISQKKHKRKTGDYSSTAESIATTIFGSTATTLFGFTTSTEIPTTESAITTSTTVMSVVPG